MKREELIYDWNERSGKSYAGVSVELNDETLRDGLQSPSATDPPVEQKIELLHAMVDLGIHSADLGLPGAGPKAYDAVLRLAREIVANDLPLSPNAAARTVRADIEPIARIQQATGLQLEVGAFIGSSPIRLYAEGWDIDRVLSATREAISFAVGEGLEVMYVTEDTTRSQPETLAKLFKAAIETGAGRICLADTVGHATPNGVRQLVRFTKNFLSSIGSSAKIDWHGHRDRGFGLANALAAIEEGADRIHATALGLGERIGNVEMDLLLVNLHLLGIHRHPIDRLTDYCRTTAAMCGIEVPHNYPVIGDDAFRTGTGVHAAAIIKAMEKGDGWLDDYVYSGIPASIVGRSQVIEVSPVSGLSNVRYWLTSNGYDAEDDELCEAVLRLAKRCDHTLTREQIERQVLRAGAAE